MDLDEIKRRLQWHQNRVNSLLTMLPNDTQVEFFTVPVELRPFDLAFERKRLVFVLTTADKRQAWKVITKAQKKRPSEQGE